MNYANLIVLALAAAPALAGDIRDHFTLTESRPAGSLLDGTTTEVGAVTWQSQLGVRVEDERGNGVVRSAAQDIRYGYVPVEPAGQVITVAADVRAVPLGRPNDNWVAIGFSKVTDHIVTIGVGQLALGVRTNGKWMLLQNGQTQVAEGKMSRFDPTLFNQIELRYDPRTRLVSARVNGEQVLSDYPLKNDFVPEVRFAGFQFANVSTDSAVEQFSVTIEEPTKP